MDKGIPKAPLITISHVAPSLESLYKEDANFENAKLAVANFEDANFEDANFEDVNLHLDRKFRRKESILSSEISLFIAKNKPNIPDGGWGWLVVVACFIINMMSDGVSFTFGLLYIEFLHEFKASKSATSWIGSLFMALPLIAGPLGSALVDKYGCRSMTIVGGIVCTIGLVLSSYVNSLGLMYLTFGVIGGLGMCLCIVTAVVSIAFWFEKRRTIAMGLAASGTGFGTAAFSPIATWLLADYGWRGTLLIIAGMFANMVVCGALMRDPDWLIEEEQREKLKKSGDSSNILTRRDSTFMEELKDALMTGGDTHYLLENIDTCMDLTRQNHFKSTINLPTYLKENEKVPIEVLKKLSENRPVYKVILENYPNLLSCRSSSDTELNQLPEENTITSSRVPLKFCFKLRKTDDIPVVELNTNTVLDTIQENNEAADVVTTPTKTRVPLWRSLSHKARSQIQPHTYLRNIRFRKNSIGYRGAMLNIHKYKMKACSCPDLFKNSISSLKDEETWYEEFLDILRDLTNFSLFLDLHFLLLSVSTIILFIWFVVPYFYLADHMKISGYDEGQSSFVISIIGITNTLGMVILGWVGDKLNVALSYAICLILCGISVGAILFFTNNYIVLTICSGLFGLFFASCLSLTPSLLTELVSLDDFTMAYGLILLCQGIGNLTGPPLAGLIFDFTQSWNQSFYQAAFWIIISGILIGFIPFTNNRRLGAKKPKKEGS